MSEIMEIAKAAADVEYEGPSDSSLMFGQLLEGLASQQKTLRLMVDNLTEAEMGAALMNHVMGELG